LIYAEDDQGVPAEQGRALAKQLEEMGKDVQLVVYPNVNHAFFNDTGRNYNAAAAADAWKRTIELFRANVK
jgi:carboxymethylenebutenolidase